MVEEKAVLVGMLDGSEKGGQRDNAVTREHYSLDTKASFQIARHGCQVWSSVLQLINCFNYVKDEDNESFLETKCIKTKCNTK